MSPAIFIVLIAFGAAAIGLLALYGMALIAVLFKTFVGIGALCGIVALWFIIGEGR